MSDDNRMADAHKSAGVDIAEADAGLRNIVRILPRRGRILASGPCSSRSAISRTLSTSAATSDWASHRRGRLESCCRRDDAQIRHDRHRLCRDERERPGLRRCKAGIAGRLYRGRAGRRDDPRRDRERAREGARQAGVKISGGEMAQVRDIGSGFDLVGTAVGTVKLEPDHRRPQHAGPATRSSGSVSSGLHSNGYTLARRVLFDRGGPVGGRCRPGARPHAGRRVAPADAIYVPESLEMLERVPTSARCPTSPATGS